MDPRPYHFEYRRPRPTNPTYQSSHLYDSMNTSGVGYPSNMLSRNRSFSNSSPTMKRANSSDMAPKKLVQLDSVQPQRYASRSAMDHSHKLNGSETGQSKMAGIGTSLMRGVTMQQGDVFKKQEKEFNIISFYPKAIKPNLRNFPKLTVQDRLLEKQQ